MRPSPRTIDHLKSSCLTCLPRKLGFLESKQTYFHQNTVKWVDDYDLIWSRCYDSDRNFNYSCVLSSWENLLALHTRWIVLLFYVGDFSSSLLIWSSHLPLFLSTLQQCKVKCKSKVCKSVNSNNILIENHFIADSSQVYSFVPDVLWQLFSFGHNGEFEIWLIASVDGCLLSLVLGALCLISAHYL